MVILVYCLCDYIGNCFEVYYLERMVNKDGGKRQIDREDYNTYLIPTHYLGGF